MSENPEKRESKKSENLENQKSENPKKTGNEPEREYETISYVNFEGKMITRTYEKQKSENQ